MKRPWWLWLASASAISYFIFTTTSFYYVRDPVGHSSEITANGIVIRTVAPASAAARAGLQAGDRLMTAFGVPQEDYLDQMIAGATLPLDIATEWVVERNGARVYLALEPMHRRWVAVGMPYVLISCALFLSLVLGIFVAWHGDRKPLTLLGGWLLVSMACVAIPLWPRSMAFEFRALPWPIQLLLWPAAFSSLQVGAQMFALCVLVTRRAIRPAFLALAVAPIAAIGIYVAFTAVAFVYDPVRAASIPLPTWVQYAGPLSYTTYFGAGTIMLVAARRQLRNTTERRRLDILIVGAAAGMVGLLIIATEFLPVISAPNAVIVLGGLLFTIFPVALAYATVRHQLFDLRIIVRLGLQYALARGAIVAVMPLLVVILFADAALHSDQTLQSILSSRGWSYAMIAMVVAMIYFKRNEWMTRIDKRFFRERYAAQQILRDVVQDVGTSNNFDTAAKKVIGRIDSALHPLMAAVLIRPKTSTAFSAVASSGTPMQAIAAGNPITQVVRALGKPVVTSTLGLHDVGELVVPIAVDPNGDEALLVLGPRKSEEPYSQEDQDLLSAVAASLRLLMGRSPADVPTVTHAGASRLLANRYRIDRPIGEGGMGYVYAGHDETLQRAVAIKVIKDQHLTGDALSRFQREARTAASLSHPNIVTIHDYGTDENGSPYLVMELLEGQSLRAALKARTRLPLDEAAAIMAGIRAAVEFAHRKGVIHRDLKPENIFLSTATDAKVLDYGIAKQVSGATGTNTTGGVIGTLAYMAPEQAAGGAAAPSWDWWAMAVIAYEIVSGTHPFGGGLPLSQAAPIKTTVPGLPDEIAASIDAALSLDPSKRSAGMVQLR